MLGQQLYEKETPTQVCFPVNIVKFLSAALFIEHLPWLILNSIKKKLQYRCLPVKFAKFIRTPFLRAALVTACEVKLVFSKESKTKTGATE